MARLNLVDVIKYYKNYSHQQEAIKLLEDYLNANPELVYKFYSIWRQNTVTNTYSLLLYPTQNKDRNNLIIFNLDLLKDNKRIDRVSVRSGAPSAQVLLPPEKDYSGSMRPIPEGNWIVGKPEKSPIGNWGEGLGEWWIELTPINPKHNRKNIGIHLDANQSYSPGSAGCVVTTTKRDLEKIIEWIWEYKVASLTVTYNLSPLAASNVSSSYVEQIIKIHAKRAIGYAEGNLTIDGKPTKNYYGHIDVGNGKYNLGAFSYQGNNAKTPEQADEIWESRLIKVLTTPLRKLLTGMNKECHTYVVLNVCDLYTQAPLAVVDRGGLLDQLTGVAYVTDDSMVDYRVLSFYDPVTKKLMAAGFGNDPNRLRKDQARRVKCIREYLLSSFGLV